MRTLFRSLIFAIAAVGATACGNSSGDDAPVAAEPSVYPDASLAEILAPPAANPYDAHLDSAPDAGCVRIPLRPIGHLRPLFNDSNHVQLEAARAIGIRPIETIADAWHTSRPLVPVSSCKDFYIDELKHSYPYLVPEASRLLHDIGAAFNDSLAARGGGGLPPESDQPAAHSRHCQPSEACQPQCLGRVDPHIRHHVRHQLFALYLRQRHAPAHLRGSQEPPRRGAARLQEAGTVLCEDGAPSSLFPHHRTPVTASYNEKKSIRLRIHFPPCRIGGIGHESLLAPMGTYP